MTLNKIDVIFRSIVSFVKRHDTAIVIAIAFIAAVLSVINNYNAGTILAYGDAESHINIAKRVVGGLTPGLGQLGGIWLPLHHIMMMPFVINDFMWRSGLGGAIVSAICYVASTFFVYKLAKTLITKPWVAALAVSIYAFNPNVLYMLGTPMSELPLLAFMTGSLFFFVRWMYDDDIRMLILAGTLAFGGMLVRYDAWFLIFIEVIAVVIIGIYKKYSRQKIEGTAIIFALPALLGAILWLLWGLVIFHDPLYFMNSEYSAKSQQQSFLTKGELPTYHNVIQSVQYYSQAVIDNIGIVFAVLAVIGVVVIVVNSKKKELTRTLVLIALLLSPFFFNVLSLYLGISILFIPELTPLSYEFHLFNVRYGMMLIPAIAVLIGLLIDRFNYKAIRIITGTAAFAVVFAFAFTIPITLKDGTEGLSARKPDKTAITIEQDFRTAYDFGYVAFDDFGRSASPVDLGIPMNRMIYVGNHPYWDNLLNSPNSVARFIVMQPDDRLWRQFHNNKLFNEDYTQIAEKGNTLLYKCTRNCLDRNSILTK